MQTEFGGGTIDTSGVTVSFDKFTGNNDALVDVEAMTYDKNGTTCPYTGRTWVHYQRGKWWYDPGTRHHPERRAEFGNGTNSTPLFRGRCA
jgi:hypothetical protein